LSETVSTRLPPELIRLMEKEAEARGISLSMLLKEIIRLTLRHNYTKPG
jgi:predicted HicB family RNase H-like nuclease